MRADAVEALRNVKIPVLRWPGGCFADDTTGGTASAPRKAASAWSTPTGAAWWRTIPSALTNSWELCRQLGCEPYINANLGSGTVQEMSEWVEYLTSGSDSTVARTRWPTASGSHGR